MKSLNRSSTAPAPRASMNRRLLTTGALLCIGVLPLSACSLFNPPLERDESVHAIFDAEQDIVKMPLDDYLYYERTNYEYTAFQIAMKQCFAEHGQNYTIQAPYSESAPRGDLGRKYGPWNVEYAQKYGFQKRDLNAAPISFNSGESMSPEERLSIECYTKARETLDAAVPEKASGKIMAPRSLPTFAWKTRPATRSTVATCTRSSKRSGSSTFWNTSKPRR